MSKKKDEITIHSLAAEYLTYMAAVGDNADSMEMRYEDENIWLREELDTEIEVGPLIDTVEYDYTKLPADISLIKKLERYLRKEEL